MNKAEKKDLVSSLNTSLKGAGTLIVTHYHGMQVSDMEELRASLREQGASYMVVKNRLVKLALKGTDFEQISDFFTGPVAVAYSEDPVSAAKGLVKFAKDNDNLKIIGGVVENNVINAEGVVTLSKTPSLDELRAMIVSVLNSPARNLLGVLSAPVSKLARVVGAYSASDK